VIKLAYFSIELRAKTLPNEKTSVHLYVQINPAFIAHQKALYSLLPFTKIVLKIGKSN